MAKYFASSKKTSTFVPAIKKMIAHAKVAQLVEHDLAKVGVAGPSPVFRSTFFELYNGTVLATVL